MMMDCPRCGFNQPKDRYCANCGLDVDQFLSKPKPLIIRILQNPNFHLSLIAVFMLLIIGYVVITRSSFVSREVRQIFGTPITSRDAADPNETAEPESAGATPAAAANEEEAPGTAALEAAVPATAASEAAPPLKDAKNIEVVFWEVAHETLAGLLQVAEKIGDSNGSRAYLFKDGARFVEAIQAGARRVSQRRNAAALAPGAQIVVATPTTAAEPFQFGMSVTVNRWENREATVRWDSQLSLSQPETPAEMASQTPVVKSVVDSNLTLSTTLNADNLLMIVIEPVNRTPRDEFLNKAGDGPWRVFTSPDFRSGVTDWVMLVQLK